MDKTKEEIYKEKRKNYLKSPRRKEVIRRRKQRKRKEFGDYKLLKGCSICGYKNCAAALELHHPNGNKEFNVSKILSLSSLGKERLKREMERCIIVCSNCHRELHAHLRGNNGEN